ncbi:hypothetical protein TKK_0006257 [Trichogramma kaykai]
MENRENSFRMKEEPNDAWQNAGDNYNSNLMDSRKVKNVETFPFYKSPTKHMKEVMMVQEKADEKIFIDFECKDLKPELKCLSTNICKTEYQSCLPIVKMENQIQDNYVNEIIHIDFECKDAKSALLPLWKTICKSEDQSSSPCKIRKPNLD